MKRITAAVTAAATMLTLMAPMAPVRAGSPSNIFDTLSRLQISVSATHSASATFPTDTWGVGETVTFDYGTALFALDASTPSCALGTGTCHAVVSSATDSVTIVCDAATCGGVLTLGSFTGTNPGTAGSKSIPVAGTGGISGAYAIAIVDSDQVTVTATVATSITFDIDTAQTDTESAAPYSVALGTITTSDTRVSGTTDGVNFIWLDLDSNASAGTVITVRNANGANGLVSTTTPADDIDSANGTMADGTENYGICSVSETDGGGNLDDNAPFDGTCAANSETNVVGGFDGTNQVIYDTDGAAVVTARAQISVNAAISTSTVGHNDYTDTLTFIATGTF